MSERETTDAADQAGVAIRDAASILLIDRGSSSPRLLMGRRRADNVFLPNKWVFPGGRLEEDDGSIATASDLDPHDEAALLSALHMPASSAFARALALAAVRELFEETGHAMAVPRAASYESGVWHAFDALGLVPTLAPLRLIARAITPPGRPRRYDTRFFIAMRDSVVENAGPGDGEFTDLGWFTFEDARALDLPNITRRVLADLEGVLARPGLLSLGPVPYYYQQGDRFCRELISRGP
ncbi:MAG: NUDIX domain-containing protein [Hyphomicrobium sp.]